MQIITGKYRARKLVHPEGDATRPTLARVKESIFSMLPLSFEGKVVLDLFAGSGAYGLEALSRGAKTTILVDNNQKSIDALKKNSRNMKEDLRIESKDCFVALEGLFAEKIKLDVVFLDPPYGSDLGEKVIAFIESHDMLSSDGIIVYEHSIDKKSLQKLLRRYIISKSKAYAGISVDFIMQEK